MIRSKYDIGLVRTVKAAVVRRGIQNVFANRLKRARNKVLKIMIASPWVTYNSSIRSPLVQIAEIINRENIPTYIFLRPPDNTAQLDAIDIFKKCPSAEIVYNANLHAKLYVCLAPYPYGFAILGSANLTVKSEELYEIGLLVLSKGGGEEILRQLASFGLDYLRTRPDSEVIKRLSLRRKYQ